MKPILFGKKYNDIHIFDGVANEHIPLAISCLEGVEKKYSKGDYIIELETKVSRLSILLEGQVYLYSLSSDGERNILCELERGSLIGGPTIFSDNNISPYSAVCVCDSKVLEISAKKLNLEIDSACPFKSLIMKNLLYMISLENEALRSKADIASIKSLREKLLNYFYVQTNLNGNKSFTIPFVNRDDFADYIGANTNALSRELGRMKKEGILDFYKNSFVLKI